VRTFFVSVAKEQYGDTRDTEQMSKSISNETKPADGFWGSATTAGASVGLSVLLADVALLIAVAPSFENMGLGVVIPWALLGSLVLLTVTAVIFFSAANKERAEALENQATLRRIEGLLLELHMPAKLTTDRSAVDADVMSALVTLGEMNTVAAIRGRARRIELHAAIKELAGRTHSSSS
jgi:hypothetical protein